MLKKLIIMMLGSFVIMISLTGCEKQKESTLMNQVTVYLKKYESLHQKEIKEYYNPKEYTFLDSPVTGLLTAAIYDFDDDEKEEALVYTIDGKEITLHYLEESKNEVEEIDTLEVTNIVPSLDEFTLSAFIVKINKEPKLFLEIEGEASLFATGRSYQLIPISLKENKLVLEDKITLEGSAFLDSDSEDYLSKVRETGLTINTITETIFSQNKKGKLLFTIERKQLKDFEPLNHTEATKVRYANTTFFDELKNEKNNVLSLENITQKAENNKKNFKEENIGYYKWKDGDDEITFELLKENNHIKYYLSYYPNGSAHASEECWGTWDSIKDEMILENENPYAIASYTISNIKYQTNKIEFTIKAKEILSKDNEASKIKNGNCSFSRAEK